jgi:hypothetical protein
VEQVLSESEEEDCPEKAPQRGRKKDPPVKIKPPVSHQPPKAQANMPNPSIPASKPTQTNVVTPRSSNTKGVTQCGGVKPNIPTLPPQPKKGASTKIGGNENGPPRDDKSTPNIYGLINPEEYDRPRLEEGHDKAMTAIYEGWILVRQFESWPEAMVWFSRLWLNIETRPETRKQARLAP